MIACCVIFGLILYFFYYHLHGKRKAYPYGPTPWPIIGNLLALNQKDPIQSFSSWGKKYGPIYTFWMGSDPNIVITDYQIMKEALIKQGDAFAGRPQNLMNRIATNDGYGLVFTEGELWKEQRRYSLHLLRDFGLGRKTMEPKIMTEVSSLVEYFEKLLNGKSEGIIDPAWSIQVCVGNIINVLLLGYRFGWDDTKIRYLTKTIADNLQVGSSPMGFALSNNPWLRHIPLFGHFGYDTLKAQMKLLHDFMFNEIEEHKKNFDPNQEEPEDFTSAYLKEMIQRDFP